MGSQTTQAVWHNTILAESKDCEVISGVYYFPSEAVRTDFLKETKNFTKCPQKGIASYFDLTVGGHTNPSAAWVYHQPHLGFSKLKGYVAFWNGVRIQKGNESAYPENVLPLEQGRQLNFLRSVPKTEIHLHLEATASATDVFQLMQQNKVDVLGVKTFEDLLSRFRVSSLNDFVSLFINVLQTVIIDEEDFAILVNGAKNYMIRNNIFYAELFFSPTNYLKRGMKFSKIVSVLERETQKVEKKDGISMKFLVDVSRTFGAENAMKNCKLVTKHRSDSIIGIGLGGAEASGPARDYVEVFSVARSAGLHVVAHAGEDAGPESIEEAINRLGAERIGHGISAIHNRSVLDLLVNSSIPVECCPTSNVFTKSFVKKLEDHPLPLFLEAGINASLNTDDPAVFGVDLIDEYMNAYNLMRINHAGIIKLIYNGLNSTFLSEEKKLIKSKEISTIIKKFEIEMSSINS